MVLYCSSYSPFFISQVIAKYMDVKYYFYVDDTQLFTHLSPGNCAYSYHQLKAYLYDIHTRMFENKLKLNLKIEFLVFGSIDSYKWLKYSFPVDIFANCPFPTDVCNLGVLFGSKFSFTNQVNSVSIMHELHCIRRLLSF